MYGSEQDENEQLVAAPGEPIPAQDEQQPVQEVTPEPAEQAAPSADMASEAGDVTPVVSRVDHLTLAIEAHPGAPVNYVLRGEALLEVGDYDLAANDFRKALELAEAQAETANWGYLYRALGDRAREGLRRVQR